MTAANPNTLAEQAIAYAREEMRRLSPEYPLIRSMTAQEIISSRSRCAECVTIRERVIVRLRDTKRIGYPEQPSFPEITRAMGRTTHSTVIQAYNRAKAAQRQKEGDDAESRS